MRHFIDAHLADKTPHSGDPVVFVAGRKSGHAVFLGVRAHAAELDDVELFAVLRQPALAVEDRAAVLQLDAERRDEHDGRCDDQADQGEHDVSEPLDDGIFQRRVIALHLQHRQMEQVGAFGGRHDQVAHPGDKVGLDGMHQAVLRDDVAVMAVDSRQKNSIRFFEHVGVGDAFFYGYRCDNFKFSAEVVLFDKAVHPLAHVVDDNGPVCRKRLKIPLLGDICPAESGRELDAEHQQQRQHVRCAADEQPGDEVHNGIHLEQREHLTVDHFALAAVRHLKRLVDPADDKIQYRVKHQNQPVSAHREMHP